MEHHPDGTPIVEKSDTAMVTHFATCPKAKDFSGQSKKLV